MRPSARTRGALAAAVLLGLTAAIAACGSDDADDDASSDTTDAAAASGSASDDASDSGSADEASLAGVCPDTIAIQTDWNPESEHGALYQLLGDDYTVDANAKTVSGPLLTADGTDTGVKVEVRAGGPAIAYQPPVAALYQDESLTLTYANTDEQVASSKDQPTLAVVAPLELNPQMIMWDPAAYPDVTTIADLGKTDAKVLYFQGATYMEFLTGSGVLKPEQVDGSYDGAPASFVASGGTIAQQGFATAEPYIYENEVPEWGKPVAFQLINDTGYPLYSQALAIRSGDKEELSDCLTAFVPIVQQAAIDYVEDPSKANALILELVDQYDTGWVYSQGVADFSVAKQTELGIVGNGPDDTLGNFDEDRVQKIIDLAGPILEEGGVELAPDLSPADLVTNEFIDPSIGLS